MKNDKQIKFEQWKALYDDYKTSGLTCREWCQTNEIKEHNFFYIRKKLGVVNSTSNDTNVAPPIFEKIDLTIEDTTFIFKVNDIKLEVDDSITQLQLSTIIKAANSL